LTQVVPMWSFGKYKSPTSKGWSYPDGNGYGERIARHKHLREHFYHVAASCNLAPRKEENALLPDTNARPADVLIPHWTEGRDTALDVTVVSPLLTDRLANSITTPSHTLTCAFNDKCRDYLAACKREGIAFIPLPVETLGGWNAKAELQIKKLARAQARTTNHGRGRGHQAPLSEVGSPLGQGECCPYEQNPLPPLAYC
jgi:hypothetical protein